VLERAEVAAMIYICKALCLPCKACDKACQELSKACQGCCNAISDFFGPITQNPLGGYVFGTWMTMLLAIGLLGYSVSKTVCEDPKMTMYILIGLAVIHGAFAYYMQRRLVSALGDQRPSEMSHKEIAEKTRQVMMYDVGFCLYFFVFCGSFFYACSALGTLGGCEGTGPAWSAAALLILYGFGVFNYAVCWYCCQCCCGQLEGAMPKSGPGAVTIGASPGGHAP